MACTLTPTTGVAKQLLLAECRIIQRAAVSMDSRSVGGTAALCTVGNRVLVGMGSTVMDGAVVEDEVIISAARATAQRAEEVACFSYTQAPG